MDDELTKHNESTESPQSDSSLTIAEAGSYEAYFDEIISGDEPTEEEQRAKLVLYGVLALLLLISVILFIVAGLAVLEYLSEFVNSSF